MNAYRGEGQEMPSLGAINKVSLLDEVSGHLSRNLGTIQDLIVQVESLGDRILGSIPVSPTDNAPTTGPASKTEGLLAVARQQEVALDRLREQVLRLESL